jgi:hypothetical protein
MYFLCWNAVRRSPLFSLAICLLVSRITAGRRLLSRIEFVSKAAFARRIQYISDTLFLVF